MKRLIVVAIFGLGLQFSAYADSVEFLITILDETQIDTVYTSGGSLVVKFDDADINEVLSAYTITKFQKEYPTSRYLYLRQIWRVEANSIQLMRALQQEAPDLFPTCGADAGNETTSYP